VRKIKRTKKTKSAKPSLVQINTRTPSPACLSDDVSASGNGESPTKPLSVSAIEQSWFESEFSVLKQQNREIKEHNKCLEEKLDVLLKLTLQVSPVTFEQIQAGEKRRRMSPVESSDAAHSGLEPIYEEKKLSHEDNYGLEPSPYEGDRKSPPVAGLGSTDDSYERFIELMLNEENEQEEEECKAGDVRQEENNSDVMSSSMAPSKISSPMTNDSAAAPIETGNEDAFEDELMEEAINAILPGVTIDTDGDLFALSEESSPHPTDMLTIANAAVDKVEGPQPIHTISSEFPAVQSGDIEEGNLPVGVTVIAAQAELIENDRVGVENTDNEALQQQREQETQHAHIHRKRVICLLAFICVVLAIGVTWPAVAAVRKKKNQQRIKAKAQLGPPLHKLCKGGGRADKHGGGCGKSSSQDSINWKYGKDDGVKSDEDDEVDKSGNTTDAFDREEFGSAVKNDTQTWTSFINKWPQSSGRKRTGSIFRKERLKRLNSFSMTLEGSEFVCSSRKDLL